MNSKIFSTSPLLTWFIIISVLTVFLGVIAILVINIFYKPVGGNEVLRYFDQDFLRESSEYHKISLTISLVSKMISLLFMVAVIFISWKYFSKTPRVPIFMALAYIALFYVILQLILLPLSYYRGFIVEHRFGLSNQTLSMWFLDFIKSWAILFVISTGALTGIYALMIYLPKHWWQVSSAVFIIFIIIGTYLYPIIIDPLFYKFEKLEDSKLKSQIIDISGKAGIEIDEVLVADASRRTSKANAYFTGIGNSKRIVIFDNLLNKFTGQQTVAVIAHEIGHWHYKHIIKNIILGSALGVLAVFLLQIILGKAGLVGNFKAILLIILLASTLSFITMPVQNTISRFFEKQADEFALKLTEDPEVQVSLTVKLASSNLSNVCPHPLIKVLLYSHPSTMERIKQAEQFSP